MSVRRYAHAALERLEGGFDAVFTPRGNPLYQLGALGWFLYWIVVVSGVYLYIFFDSGVTEAYASIQRLSDEQWYAGGIMRSLHRYASDALVLVVLAHLLREYIHDRMRGPRWFAWVTGVALLWLIFAAGISGFWIVWDLLAQYVAIGITEWLDVLPLFGEPVARNFLHPGSLSGRFFTLMVFIHIAVPLVLLLLMWVHIQRHAQPRVNPSPPLMFGTLAAMLALALLQPVYSQGMADLGQVPGTLELDWFYLPMLPVSEHIGHWAAWGLVAVGTIGLTLLPWLPRRRAPAVAEVNLEHCNGCGRCHDDCPFGAVTMEPRTDGAPYRAQAVVDASQCVACGICTGACPTATPFRTRNPLLAGIEQPELTMSQLRQVCVRTAERLTGPGRVLIFGCGHGAPLTTVLDDHTAPVELPCVGMLPPSLIDFLISRRHVDGVMLTGCRQGSCHYRLGINHIQDRVHARRDPYLRQRVPRARVGMSFTGVDREAGLRKALVQLRVDIQLLEGREDESRESVSRPTPMVAEDG